MIPISLGYNCHVKVYIDRIGESIERAYFHQPFDWIGTPMWAICEAIETDFSGFCDRSLITLRKRFADKPDEFLTHSQYIFSYIHDFGKNIHSISEEKWKAVSEKYQRRIERWKTTLQSGKPLLFIRLETDQANRIEYPEFEREHDEKFYVEKFADLMKTASIPFTLLFLSTSYPQAYDKERNICTIQFKKVQATHIIGADSIEKILQMNMTFIHSCLNQQNI
jgi:hypothetical protein